MIRMTEKEHSARWKRFVEDNSLVLPEYECNRMLTDNDIQGVVGMMGPDDTDLLVNLWWACKMMHGLHEGFNMRQIGEAIAKDPAYSECRVLIDLVRTDAMHWPDNPHARVQNLRLRRFTPSAEGLVPSGTREGNELHTTNWLLYLSETHDGGGQYYWPSRHAFAYARAGNFVRWPGDIPWGMTPVSGHEALFVLTGQSTTKEGSKGEPWPDQEKVIQQYEWGLD